MEAGSADGGERFSLVLGGPFHGVLHRLGLTGADHLPTQGAALLLALVAWLLPALLVAAQSLADDGYSGWGHFTDWTVHTRYLIGIWAMIATERYADGRLASHHHLAFHHKWIVENRSGEELMGSPEPSSVSDLNASVEMVQEMRVFPVDRAAAFQLLIAAGVPMLAVVGTQLPFLDLVK